MKKLLLIYLFFVPYMEPAFCQIWQKNHITVREYGDAVASDDKALVTRTYYDGLGRKRQTVAANAGGEVNSIAERTDYDRRGNVFREWLPVPTATGGCTAIVGSAYESASATFYGEGEFPYTKKEYEETGQNRISYVQGAGKLWQRHGTRYEYTANDSTGGSLSCRLLTVTADGGLTATGYYRPGTLKVKKEIGPDGTATLCFTDRNGRAVLSRTVSADGTVTADTRHVYDSRGDLRHIISPEGMSRISGDGETDRQILHLYADSYTYDIWHRVIERHPSGRECEEYVYDRMNRLAMSRNGEQRKRGVWRAIKYDHLGRKAVEGFLRSAESRKTMQKAYGDSFMEERRTDDGNTAEFNLYYSNGSTPSGFEPYMSWMYDDYGFAEAGSLPDIPSFMTDSGLPAKGLCTGTAEKVDGNVVVTVIRHDHMRNPIYRCRYDLFLQNFRTTECMEYDFRGNLTRRLERTDEMAEQTVLSSHEALWSYELDCADRIARVMLSVDGSDAVEIQANEYDAVGRLKATTAGVRTEYGYDTRSDVVSISSPQFVQRMYYAQNPFNPDNVRYGGDLCAATEGHRDEELAVSRDFTYRYDPLGRLATAESMQDGICERLQYDLNANVTQLERTFNGDKVQDAVTGLYGNQTVTVNDVSLPYHSGTVPSFTDGCYSRTYDTDGRIVSDGTRGISVMTYHDCNNMPRRIEFSNGDYMQCTYLPSGTLLDRTLASRKVRTVTRIDRKTGDTVQVRQTYYDTESHQYRGAFERTDGRWRLHTETGYYDLTERKHYYYVRDRLGSTVAVVDGDGRTQQLTAYYPSGVPYDLFSFRRVTDRLHIGNRWMAHSGYCTYDNTARMHYPLIPSFDTPDPMEHEYPWLSPYSHCAGNPLTNIDPSGKDNYCVNRMGYFNLTTKTIDNFDNLYSSDKEKIVLDKGILSNIETKYIKQKISGIISDATIQILSFKDNSNPLFEFLINNTDVEWSQTVVAESNSTYSYISTSHSESSDASASYIISNLSNGTKVVNANHSHPSLSRTISKGDVSFAKQVQQKHPNAKLKIYIPFDFENPQEFNKDSQYGVLPELIVTPE